ncbi:hypothetical protein Lser_V15G16329 [Lactuca serriola]
MSTSSDSIPMATLLHMVTIKLTSFNYLLWRNQFFLILTHQKWLSFVDGSSVIPEATITLEGNTTENPTHSDWVETDQRVPLPLQSSLTDVSMIEVLGHTTSRSLWCALESLYNHASKEQAQNLKDSFRQLRKGDSSVSKFGKKLKSLWDQLEAIGQPVPTNDKSR